MKAKIKITGWVEVPYSVPANAVGYLRREFEFGALTVGDLGEMELEILAIEETKNNNVTEEKKD